MPPVEYETVALWWDLPGDLPGQLAARGLDFLGGLHAVEHAAIGILPLFAMCDRWDIGGLSTPRHPDTDAPQIFIYDGFPGGVGIAEKGFDLLPELWSATLDVIQGCPCEAGARAACRARNAATSTSRWIKGLRPSFCSGCFQAEPIWSTPMDTKR